MGPPRDEHGVLHPPRPFRAAGRVEGEPLDVGVLLDPDVLAEVDSEAVTFVPPPRRAGVE